MGLNALTDALLAEPSTERPAPLLDRDRFVYDRAPLLVYWEATRACDLACQHCRADAIAKRHPLELATDEAKRLFDDIKTSAEEGGRAPHIVVTGGDPLHRPDLFELIAYGRDHGLT
ncbi:MAG: radical SAM protein, partial [Candidatus Bipolaricaulia bacterium]